MENSKIKYPEISQELIAMGESDQLMRNQGKWDARIDSLNTKKLKKIISKIGWPSISKVGNKASDYAWLIAQHADHDVEFQKQAFKLLGQEPRSEINVSHLAYLEDRINVNSGEPQRFGTQFHTDEKGMFRPRPIANEKQLDKLREAFSLPPFKVYKKVLEEMQIK